jgi:hypothetical protein
MSNIDESLEATEAAETLVGALTETANSDDPAASAWETFGPSAQATLGLSDAELDLPACSDDEEAKFGKQKATRVATWFHSHETADHFARWTDPRTWDIDCSIFFKSVELETPGEVPDGVQEFSAVFIEVVQLSTTKTLVTPLLFTRTIDPPELFALTFAMPPGRTTKDLSVDSGSMVVRESAHNPASKRTKLFAEKFLLFTDPALKAWPTLSCDLFWMELTILAALGCRNHDLDP